MSQLPVEPPRQQDPTQPAYWRWLYRLWHRVTQPGQIKIAQLDPTGGTANQIIKVNAGTSAFEFATVAGTSPVDVTFGTGTVAISHGTSGVASGTYGGTAGIPRIVVTTHGHISSINNTAIVASNPITLTLGTGTTTWGHNTSGVVTGTYGSAASVSQVAVDTYGHVTSGTNVTIAIAGTQVTGADVGATTPIAVSGTTTNALLRPFNITHAVSGVVTGTYGGASVIPQVVVNTFGHVTAVNTFGLTGTAVTGADVSVTAPITVSGTSTNAVLRPFTVAHATSGIATATGTFGSASVIPQVVVDTYGHVRAVNTLNVAINGTAVTGADLTVSSPLLGTVTNALLRAGTIAHATSGITPGAFGGAASIPQVVVTTYGHVSAINTFALTGTAVSGADVSVTSPITVSGTSTNAVLRPFTIAHATSGAIPGTYGSASSVSQVVVNTYGHVTSGTNVAIAIAASAVTGANVSVTSPITISGTTTNAVLRGFTIAHGTSGIVPGTYGGAASIPQIVVTTYGHVTAINTFAPTTTGTGTVSVTSPITISAGTGDAAALKSFTLAHAVSGVVTGTYGTLGIPQIVVNTTGHVTSVGTLGWMIQKDSVADGETLTIPSGYEAMFGQDFTINGTGSIVITGQLHIV
jgi:hypothetical protein